MLVQCSECDSLPIKDLQPFLDHMKTRHFAFCDSKYEFECPLCNKSFIKKNFRRHFVSVHSHLFVTSEVQQVGPTPEVASDPVIIQITQCADTDDNPSPLFCEADYVDEDYCSTESTEAPSPSQEHVTVQDVFSKCDSFLQELLARPDMPIKLAMHIHNQLLDTISSVSELFQPHVDSHVYQNVADIVNMEKSKRSSQYLTTQLLQNKETYIAPQACVIGYRQEVRVKQGVGQTIETRNNNLAWIPIRETLQHALKSSSLANNLLFTSTCLTSHPDHPLAAGRAKQVCEMLGGQDSIMLQLYIDDYGTANPLGYASATNKVVGCYYRILNLPSKLQTIDTVFLCFLALKNDVDNLQNIVQTVLVPQLLALEQEGINVTVNGESKKLPVVLHSIVGDNAGLHELVNLILSWIGNSPCRFCKLTYAEIKQANTVAPSALKDKEWYDTVLRKPPAEWMKHGIQGACALNELAYFKTMDTQCVDMMHDILEGHLRCLLATTAQFLSKNGFSVPALNSAIAYFPFAGTMADSKPGPICMQDVKDGELKHSTATKTLNLTLMLPLVLHAAEYKIDMNQPMWRTFSMFLEILDILLASRITPSMLSTFETKVAKYLRLFIDIGGKMTVKPHYLLHYGDVIRRHGPVIHHWCMRYESKHKAFKQYARVNFNRQDLAMTLAKKHAFHTMKVLEAIQNPNYVEQHDQHTARRLYKKDMVVVYDIDASTRFPMFGKIESVDYETRALKLHPMQTEGFSRIVHAFKVNNQSSNSISFEVHADRLIDHHSFPIYCGHFVRVTSLLSK